MSAPTLRARRRPLLYVLSALVALTLAFIFGQSVLPPSLSGEESGRVAGFLSSLLPPSGFTDFLVGNVRKIAHFSEFALLGTEVFFLLRFALSLRGACIHAGALLFGFFVGFLDETIQIFSDRGPAIADVWLDAAGFACFYVLLLLAFSFAERKKKSVKENKNVKEKPNSGKETRN